MSPRQARRTRVLVALWIVVGVIVWNGVYDLVMFRGVQAYLFRNALHQLGRGPEVAMKPFMAWVIRDAVRTSTMWAGAVVVAGLATIRWSQRSG